MVVRASLIRRHLRRAPEPPRRPLPAASALICTPNSKSTAAMEREYLVWARADRQRRFSRRRKYERLPLDESGLPQQDLLGLWSTPARYAVIAR
jgi:hypothetical protein